MELINKQKLLEWLSRNIDANQLSQGGIALKTLREKVVSGTFDDHSTQGHCDDTKEEKTMSELCKHEWQEVHHEDFILVCTKCKQLSDKVKVVSIIRELNEERNALLEGLKQALNTIDDSISIGEMEKRDFQLMPWCDLLEESKRISPIIAKIERSTP